MSLTPPQWASLGIKKKKTKTRGPKLSPKFLLNHSVHLLNSLSLGCYIGALTKGPELVVERTREVSFPPPSFALPLSSFTDGKARDTWVNKCVLACLLCSLSMATLKSATLRNEWFKQSWDKCLFPKLKRVELLSMRLITADCLIFLQSDGQVSLAESVHILIKNVMIKLDLLICFFVCSSFHFSPSFPFLQERSKVVTLSAWCPSFW